MSAARRMKVPFFRFSWMSASFAWGSLVRMRLLRFDFVAECPSKISGAMVNGFFGFIGCWRSELPLPVPPGQRGSRLSVGWVTLPLGLFFLLVSWLFVCFLWLFVVLSIGFFVLWEVNHSYRYIRCLSGLGRKVECNSYLTGLIPIPIGSGDFNNNDYLDPLVVNSGNKQLSQHIHEQ